MRSLVKASLFLSVSFSVFPLPAYADCDLTGSADCTVEKTQISGTNAYGMVVNGGNQNTISTTGTLTLIGSIYQRLANGFVVQMSSQNIPPVINFNGGALWDISSSYTMPSDVAELIDPSGSPVSEVLNSLGMTITNDNGGDIVIQNGYFNGNVNIYKGDDKAIQYYKTQDGQIKNFEITSQGNIRLYGGKFYFNNGASEISLKASVTASSDKSGNVFLYDPTFNVGYVLNPDNPDDLSQKSSATVNIGNTFYNLGIYGGTYNVDKGSTLAFGGSGVTLENNATYQPVKFSGAGTIEFSSGSPDISSGLVVNINSQIYWNEGVLKLSTGGMILNNNVTVNQFLFGSNDGSTLSISDGYRLTVLDKLTMLATTRLVGDGELYLNEKASAIFGSLDFGSVRLNEGSAIFTGNSLLTNLYGGNGKIYVNAQLSVENLFLENSELEMNEGLNVTNLDFGTSGTIKFTANKSLTLRSDSTIYNTKIIDTTASQGTITIASGYGLNFADDETAPGQEFVSEGLNLQIEEGSSLNFNGTKATVNDVTVKKGAANFNSGETNVNNLVIGDAGAVEAGTNTVAKVEKRATLNASNVNALIGAQMVVNGNLTVGEILTNGGRETYSSVSGTGTLTITEEATFNGWFDNFNSVVLDASSQNVTANFNGLSGKDSIANLTLKSTDASTATAYLTGSLTLDSLNFDETYGGVVEIADGAILGIRHTSDISGENAKKNVIKGLGTLELLGSTSINFGGSGEYLGGLKIGSGTATITQEADLGSVTFSSLTGGTLNILDGVVLNVQSSVTTAGTNKITGGGTLKLEGDANGTFGASIEDLGVLEIGNGTATFNYNATLGNVVFTSGGTGKIEIAKGTTVTLSKELNLAQSNSIVGEGTLNLTSAANAVLNTGNGSLGYLLVGSGTASFNKDSSLNNLNFASTEGGTVEIGSGLTLTINNVLNMSGANAVSGSGTLSLNNGAVANFGGNIGGLQNLEINNATATFNADTALQNVVFASTNGVLTVGNGVRVTLTQDMTTTGNNNITGAGTLFVSDGKKLSLNSSISGLGNLLLGNGSTANFNQDGSLGTISFASDGALSTVYIDGGKTLSVSGGITVGENNEINGTGTLLLAGNASGVFGGSDDIEGTLKIGTGTASFVGDKTVANIAFVSENGGTINIVEGTTLTVDANIATSGTNVLTGKGVLVLKDGANAAFGAEIASLGTLSIGSGKAAFNANAHIDAIDFVDETGGEISIASGKVLTLYSDFSTSGANILSGDGVLNFANGVNGTIGSVVSSLGGIRIGSGTLNINETSNIGNVSYTDADGEIVVAASKTLSLSSDFVTNDRNKLTGDGTLAMKGSAGAVFNAPLDFNGTITAETGTLRFNHDGNAGTIKIGTAGVLDLDVSRVTASTVDLGTGSTLALRIARKATNDAGYVIGGNVGVLQANTVNVAGPSTLKITVDYGVVTAVNGTEFKFIEGTVNNGDALSVQNNRYRFEKTSCDGGLCYNVFQTSNGSAAAGEAGGSQNNKDTAAAFLDGRFFAEGTSLAQVAEHLDKLSQHEPDRYVKALTALAPDVTGASTRQPINMSGHIMDTVTRRMSSLSPTAGMDYRYRNQNFFGRSGGTPYDYKYMPARDYFRRAGYGSQDETSSPVRQKYYRQRPRSAEDYSNPQNASGARRDDPYYREITTAPETREDRLRRRARQTRTSKLGAWAQAFYNASEYISSGDPNGFSGNTTGIAVGIDAQVADGVIAGIGYAHTSSSIDMLQRESDITGDSLFLYSMYKPNDWFVSGIFNYGKMSTEETKDLSGIMMNDNYDSSSYALQVNAGYDFGWWKPSFGLRYSSLSTDSRADSIGQQINSTSATVASAIAEVRFSKDYVSEDGERYWKPELRLGLTYDLSSDDNDAEVTLPNGSFYTVHGDALDKAAAEIGFGVTYLVSDRTDIYFGYNGEFRKDYTSHTGMLNFRYNF